MAGCGYVGLILRFLKSYTDLMEMLKHLKLSYKKTPNPAVSCWEITKTEAPANRRRKNYI